MYYVYVLINPKLDVPFYVGKGKNNRKLDHFSDARKNKCKNKHLQRTILNLWEQGYEIPIIIALETEHENEAFEKEISLIFEYGRRDLETGTLVNLTGGGEGVTAKSQDTIDRNTKSTNATKAKWSEEKKKDIANEISKSLKNLWSNLSNEEVQERTLHIRKRTYLDKLTEEEKTIKLKEWREKNGEIVRLRMQQMSDEEKQKHKEAVKIGQQNRSPEAKKEHSEKVKKIVTDMWATLTPEERFERTKTLRAGRSPDASKKASETRKKSIAAETKEEKENRIQRHKDAAKKIDWKAINKKTIETKKSWSDEQKLAHSQKMRENALKRWNKK